MLNKTNYTDIYLVRHGLPDYANDTLTPDGKIEAEETSKFLSKIPFDVIYASSQGRAVATAEPTASKLGLPINKLDWAREDKAGEYMSAKNENGNWTWCFFVESINKKFFELQNNPNWYDDPLFKDTKYKEGIEFYNKEVDNWLLSMNIRHDRKNGTFEILGPVPKTVALFAHGGMATQTIPSLLDMNYPDYCISFQHLDTCAYSVIRIWHNGRAYLTKHNVKPVEMENSFNEMKN